MVHNVYFLVRSHYVIGKCQMNYPGGKNLKFAFSGHNLISCICFDSGAKSV